MSDDMARHLIDAVYFLASATWRAGLGISISLIGVIVVLISRGSDER